MTVKSQFPFLYSLRGAVEKAFPWHALPETYAAQAVTGLLFAAPFTLFALPAVAMLFKKDQVDHPNEKSAAVSLHGITTGLLGSFLFSFLPLLTFFWVAMRYAEDFMPVLTLLSLLGFWYGSQRLSWNSNKGKIFIAVGLLLASMSILVGIFLAFSILFPSP